VRGIVGVLSVWAIWCGTAPGQVPDLLDPAKAPALCDPPVLSTADDTPVGCPRLYAEVDYLLRWFKPVCLTPAVLSVGNPAAPVPGAVSQPGTQVVVGQLHKFEFDMTSGIQVAARWEWNDRGFGLEARGFVMEQAAASQQFAAGPNGSPATYLNYQAPDNSQQALPFTIPGVVTGGSVAVGSTKVWGVETDFALPITRADNGQGVFGTFLVGSRYLDLTDRVRLSNALSLVGDPAAVAFGADQFITRNQFVGPQVGTRLGLQWGRWSVEYTTLLAAGLTHQVRIIEGSPLLAATAVSPLLVPGPLLALPSNIGRETAWRVTLVPEIGLKTRVALADWCSVSLGYSLLYWNKVLCPGDQMDPHVNISQLPVHGPVTGARAPMPLFVHTDYFAQGLDLGLEIRF
jgi:hypothetical protein